MAPQKRQGLPESLRGVMAEDSCRDGVERYGRD